MPFTRKYNPGSIIYFQGDKGDEIFVLREGSVTLIKPVHGETQEEREELKVGEFFGVKSGLGALPTPGNRSINLSINHSYL